MSRKVLDCRDAPNEKGCTLTISGEEEEVLNAGVQHAVSVHGHASTPQLREEMRQHLKPEIGQDWSPAGRIDTPERPGVTRH